MTKILAIDTSTDMCSAALFVDHNIYDRGVIAPSAQTKFILSMVTELLAEAQLDCQQLDAIAFGRGPGSFTGVRLAVSVAQGLAFASSLPVIGISTLRVLAQEVFVEFNLPQVLVAQDARMQEVYWGEYQADDFGVMQPLVSDKLIKPHEAEVNLRQGFVGIGDGFSNYKDLFAKNYIPIMDKRYVQAKYMVQIAAAEFIKGEMVSAEKALPIYLRERVAWV
jgi:tRNA threonylcarbamoyladenosine biosynthesis protein TsaB